MLGLVEKHTDAHVLLIQNSKFQRDTTSATPDMTLEFLLKNPCIMRTTGGGALSYHLSDGHMLLIQNTKFRPDTASGSRVILA